MSACVCVCEESNTRAANRSNEPELDNVFSLLEQWKSKPLESLEPKKEFEKTEYGFF